MSIRVQIMGTIQFGIAIYPHTLYRIHVIRNNQGWYIYRRYRQFLHLHDVLTQNDLVLKEALKPHFPEKQFLSSQRQSVIEYRLAKLEGYLQKIAELQNYQANQHIESFFDFQNQGQSGALRALSSRRIVFECICEVTQSYLREMPYLWSTCYAVLTVEGYIYVLQSMYDSIENPLILFVVTHEVHIMNPAGTTIIQLQNRSTNQRLSIRMIDLVAIGSWLRVLAEFATKSVEMGTSLTQRKVEAPSATNQMPVATPSLRSSRTTAATTTSASSKTRQQTVSTPTKRTSSGSRSSSMSEVPLDNPIVVSPVKSSKRLPLSPLAEPAPDHMSQVYGV